jgi:hypothetical protein
LPQATAWHTVAGVPSKRREKPMQSEHVAELRRSIDALPERARRAMLVGLDNNTVITGAFSGGGGVCPMLAAHRAGGRTTCVSFPEAWDRFTGVYGRGFSRPATPGEIKTLRREIEASLERPQTSEFSEVIAEHTAMVEGRRRRERLFSGSAVDLGGAIEEHKASARRRRRREATDVGLEWLFEETLVLPDDFGREAERERDGELAR